MPYVTSAASRDRYKNSADATTSGVRMAITLPGFKEDNDRRSRPRSSPIPTTYGGPEAGSSQPTRRQYQANANVTSSGTEVQIARRIQKLSPKHFAPPHTDVGAR